MIRRLIIICVSTLIILSLILFVLSVLFVPLLLLLSFFFELTQTFERIRPHNARLWARFGAGSAVCLDVAEPDEAEPDPAAPDGPGPTGPNGGADPLGTMSSDSAASTHAGGTESHPNPFLGDRVRPCLCPPPPDSGPYPATLVDLLRACDDTCPAALLNAPRVALRPAHRRPAATLPVRAAAPSNW